MVEEFTEGNGTARSPAPVDIVVPVHQGSVDHASVEEGSAYVSGVFLIFGCKSAEGCSACLQFGADPLLDAFEVCIQYPLHLFLAV